MMINPTRQQKNLIEKYEKEVLPWIIFNPENNEHMLRPETPMHIQVFYDLYINDGKPSTEEYFQYYQKHQHLFR